MVIPIVDQKFVAAAAPEERHINIIPVVFAAGSLENVREGYAAREGVLIVSIEL